MFCCARVKQTVYEDRYNVERVKEDGQSNINLNPPTVSCLPCAPARCTFLHHQGRVEVSLAEALAQTGDDLAYIYCSSPDLEASSD